ncbi:uncharacterized protein LOC124256350 [Haliotis rubra]|uniref:uncharacterized protein LOC124256350 n=1 Tax=Haliotis rubra TaxID=36100 RepID=UPI001EE56F7B|nr:uncharacterized protein LOC124256350 [Haliotis rubra]
MPPLPLRRQDLVFPDEYKTTISGDPFLLIDDGHDKRILGFSTADNLCYLCESDTIYGNGTFFVAPTIFHQLYTIHGMVDGNMFPLVFFFLPDTKEDTYTRMFRLLVDAAATRGHHLDPQKIQMDYEVASRNASAIVFPRSEWKGCFFHFTQCVLRRTQQHHIQKAYQDDDEIERFVRRCAVLPLVPAQEVEDLWLDTLATMPDDDRCRQLGDYITNFCWVEGDLHMTQWNHHSSDGPRTNNPPRVAFTPEEIHRQGSSKHFHENRPKQAGPVCCWLEASVRDLDLALPLKMAEHAGGVASSSVFPVTKL